MTPNGKTSFNGKARPAVNFIDRTGTKIGNVTLVKPAYSGAWFGRCDRCGQETIYSKEKVRRGAASVRCCP